MQSMQVVPRFNPAKDIQPGLCLVRPASAVDEFALERGQEALGHGVVICIAHRAHGGVDFHLLAALAKGDAGVLAAHIAVVNDLLGTPSLGLERACHGGCAWWSPQIHGGD